MRPSEGWLAEQEWKKTGWVQALTLVGFQSGEIVSADAVTAKLIEHGYVYTFDILADREWAFMFAIAEAGHQLDTWTTGRRWNEDCVHVYFKDEQSCLIAKMFS